MIYITYESSVIDAIGIRKKVMAQCRVFEKTFGTLYYTLYSGQMMYLFCKNRLIDKKLALTKKECNEVLIDWIVQYKIERSYIRYGFSDRYFLEFLQRQERLGIKSVLEFPTIPYDNEKNSSCMAFEDCYYREQLYKYIHCCTTYGDFKEVFQIPCISLVNGVDMKEQEAKKYRKQDGKITLVAVATFSKWHGYERVIQGLHQYYTSGGKRTIVLNFVGNGGQLQYYTQLTMEYQLCEHVIFCGQKSKAELDAIYDSSDIAIGSLGFYKTGIQSGAPIKLREYCARGIPFVYGYDDLSFRTSHYFAYQVSNDAAPINMQKIIDFYENVYDGRDFISDMRQYATENLTWDTILQPVLDYLK